MFHNTVVVVSCFCHARISNVTQPFTQAGTRESGDCEKLIEPEATKIVIKVTSTMNASDISVTQKITSSSFSMLK